MDFVHFELGITRKRYISPKFIYSSLDYATQLLIDNKLTEDDLTASESENEEEAGNKSDITSEPPSGNDESDAQSASDKTEKVQKKSVKFEGKDNKKQSEPLKPKALTQE